MNIVKPEARIEELKDREGGVRLLQKIELCARLSHRSEELMTENSWERFIRSVVLGHGDWSVTEHASLTVFVVCDRGISHEWVRHRIGAYTQESTRFCNYGKKGGEIDVICPFRPETDERSHWLIAVTEAECRYLNLLALGVAPQMARSVLPNSLATRLYVTYNLRSWRHFLIMRTCREAHPQMKEITLPLLAQMKDWIPLLFDDIVAEEKQSVAMAKMR